MEDTVYILNCLRSLLLKPMTKMHAVTGEESGPNDTLEVAAQFGPSPSPPLECSFYIERAICKTRQQAPGDASCVLSVHIG